MKPFILLVLILCMFMTGCDQARNIYLLANHEITFADASPVDTTLTDVTANRDGRGRPASLLSAFFGLDDALPRLSDFVICDGAAGKDGMPIIFPTKSILVRCRQGISR